MTGQPSIQKEDAPAPDQPGKPETPPKVKKDTWKYVLGRTVHEFIDDHCTDIAATLTYYGILAMFPALLALVAGGPLSGIVPVALEREGDRAVVRVRDNGDSL